MKKKVHDSVFRGLLKNKNKKTGEEPFGNVECRALHPTMCISKSHRIQNIIS